MNHKKISIIIVTWNTAKITQKCLRSINKFLPKSEIIVVDNGSADNTLEILSNEKNLKIIENHSNLGFSQANNIGLKQATGDYLLFINSDIELIDNSLLDMLAFIKNHPHIGLIGPKFLNPDLTPQASVFPKQSAFNAFKEFYLGRPYSYSKYLPDSSEPVKVWAISGGCLLVKKTFFESIGGWNEKYFFYFEDLDLCRKVNQIGQDVYFYPQCQVIHRHGASGVKLADQSHQWRRLIPGSKKYHGLLGHYFINFIIWSGQKLKRIYSLFTTK